MQLRSRQASAAGGFLTLAVIEDGIEVLDVAEAVAAERQAVGTEAQAIVANVERTLALKWRVRVPIWLHAIFLAQI